MLCSHIGVPPDMDYPWIFASETTSDLDTDIIFYIRQYSYLYPYPEVRCKYRYDKCNILSVSDPNPKVRCLIMIAVWMRLFFN